MVVLEAIPSVEQIDSDTREYVLSLMAGFKPAQRPDCGRWSQIVDAIEDAYNRSQQKAAIVFALVQNLSERFPEFETLLFGSDAPRQKEAPAQVQQTDSDSSFPALPESARLPEGLSRGASKWLDAYEDFSKHWSPKGFDHFHTAIGIWILSTIAAHRVYLPEGPGGEFTPLFIALVAPTSRYAKSTTAKIAKALLRDVHLAWLSSPDTITPQKLMSNLSGRLPADYGDLDEEDQYWARKRCAMSGQVSWFYDEFGQHLDAITAKNGIMADFKGILRRLDDCEKEASYDTISRGLEKIENPYMALLACMTPSDIKPYAGKDAKFWRDGFFARFAFITPPNDNKKRSDIRFPEGEMFFPAHLTKPLEEWHEQLGEPDLVIEETKNKRNEITRYQPIRKNFPIKKCTIAQDAREAFYRYGEALEDLVAENQELEILAGNYQRFAKKALRIAMLLASLENGGNIELNHWARGQDIAEQWRKDLHELYTQVTAITKETPFDIEQQVLEAMKPDQWFTANEIRRNSRRFRAIPPIKFEEILMSLARSEEIRRTNEKGVHRYQKLSKAGEAKW